MAPYLYLFVSDVLGYMINDSKYSLEAFTLRDGYVLCR